MFFLALWDSDLLNNQDQTKWTDHSIAGYTYGMFWQFHAAFNSLTGLAATTIILFFGKGWV